MNVNAGLGCIPCWQPERNVRHKCLQHASNWFPRHVNTGVRLRFREQKKNHLELRQDVKLMNTKWSREQCDEPKRKFPSVEWRTFNVGKWRKSGEIAKLSSKYVILLLCEFVGLFLIMNSCESMTDLQWALLVRQKIMHCANNTQLSLFKKKR